MLLHSLGIDAPLLTDVLLVQEALNRGIEVSKDPDKWFISLSQGKQNTAWRDGVTLRNVILVRRLTARPAALAQFLNAYDQPGSGAIAFPVDAAKRAWAWAEGFQRVVVKSVLQDGEAPTYLDIETWEDFQLAFVAVAEAGEGGVLVAPYVVGEHYRCLVVGGVLLAAVRIRPAGVVGNGQNSIDQLVTLKNENRGVVHLPLTRGRREMRMLDSQGLTPDSIPDDGTFIQLRNTGQLQMGGDAIESIGSLTRSEIRRIQDAVNAVPGLRIAEVIVSVPRLEEDDALKILDIKSTVRLDIYHYPWEGHSTNVAAGVLDALFPKSS